MNLSGGMKISHGRSVFHLAFDSVPLSNEIQLYLHSIRAGD